MSRLWDQMGCPEPCTDVVCWGTPPPPLPGQQQAGPFPVGVLQLVESWVEVQQGFRWSTQGGWARKEPLAGGNRGYLP